MSDRERQVRVVYRGDVQGVGFRYTVRELAEQMGVAGGVENRPDGSVWMVAEGGEGLLRSFLAQIRASRVGGYIADEQVTWEGASGISGFYWR